MSTTSDELRRVQVRIGDLEHSLAKERHRESSHALDNSDRQRVLSMLAKTLGALKARRFVLERLGHTEVRLPPIEPH
jgi:hypothetical protein